MRTRSVQPLAIALLCLCLLGLGLCSPLTAPAAAPAGQKATARLERQKLRQETRKLRLENDHSGGWRGWVSDFAPFVTALVALVGLFLAAWKQITEQSRQRGLDRDQREADRIQRERESRRDLDERFSAILADLGAVSEALQAGAAVSLLTFLRPQHQAFHHQVRLIALANLKVEHRPAIVKLLIRTFEAAMTTDEPFEAAELDFSGAQLSEVRLVGLELSGADLRSAILTGADFSRAKLNDVQGRGAQLEKADLSKRAQLVNARFPEARCAGACFDDSELVNAHFEGADLRRAKFRNAKLQAAHLDADLRGANFEGANVADTYFRKATLDDVALGTLRGASKLEKAHLSEEQLQRLAHLEVPKPDR